MATTRTVHTPEPVKTFKISFPQAKITEFGRVDPTSGWMRFRCKLTEKNMRTLFEHMEWREPGERTSLEKLDGKLVGGHLVLNPKLSADQKLAIKSKDGAVDPESEMEIGYDTMTDFQCLRLELEGRKGKGFRHELRFTVKFHKETTCSEIELYQFRTDNAEGGLTVTYEKEPEQGEIPYVKADPEVQQRVLGEEAPTKEETDKKVAQIRDRIANPPKKD